MYEIVLDCEALGRHDQMGVTNRLFKARLALWAQVSQIVRKWGDDVEMRENVWLDTDGAMCQGLEWVHRLPSGEWSGVFRLYIREQADSDTGRWDPDDLHE
jgi:hypothetical protein